MEIELYELILILRKRIKLIISILILGTVLAGIISSLSSNIYEVRATLLVESFIMPTILKELQWNLSSESNMLPLITPLSERESRANYISLSTLNSLEFKKRL